MRHPDRRAFPIPVAAKNPAAPAPAEHPPQGEGGVGLLPRAQPPLAPAPPGPGDAGGRPQPFPRATRAAARLFAKLASGPPADDPADDPGPGPGLPGGAPPGSGPAGADPLPEAPALPLAEQGIERRLARRAETIWVGLAAGGRLPDAGESRRFTRPPFSDHAVLLAFPPHPRDPRSPLPRVLRVGAAVARLGLCQTGCIAPDERGEAPPAARIAALAAHAVAIGEPVRFEQDAPEALAPTSPCPAASTFATLLLRAIALPFAASPPAGPLAVVILSWRRLLSDDEAARLSQQLRDALDALRGSIERSAG